METFSRIRFALESAFDPTTMVSSSSALLSKITILIGGVVSMTYVHNDILQICSQISTQESNTNKNNRNYLIIEWEGSMVGDIIADGVVAIILQINGELKKISRKEKSWIYALRVGDYFSANKTELNIISDILQMQFGFTPEINEDLMLMTFFIDGNIVCIDHSEKKVRASVSRTILERFIKAF